MSAPEAWSAGGRFALGLEQECMTTRLGPGTAEATPHPLRRLLELIGAQAPSLAGPTGWFNGYGRVYVDCGDHVELATAECDSPYLLATVHERLQIVVARALHRLREHGVELALFNNNHSGLLAPDSPTWGSHENYLVERRPAEFAAAIMPFLATRTYAGAGGVLAASGRYVASVRALFIEQETGGDTRTSRALHSTCREEHHTGRPARGFRYHLLPGDGHRSHFNLALQFGATALALRAIAWDAEFAARMAAAKPRYGSWIRALHALNLLAEPGAQPRVPSIAIAVQREYLDACERWAAAQSQPQPWIASTLRDWRATLEACERNDRAWLSARLDSFAKYELLDAALARAGRTWRHIATDTALQHELALLEQGYHRFEHPASPFERAVAGGLLAHRVAPRIEPGGEREPFVIETATRARARARFVREHAGEDAWALDWSYAADLRDGRWAPLADPFAAEFAPWEPAPIELAAVHLRHMRRRPLSSPP